jgi:hypothetical protein
MYAFVILIALNQNSKDEKWLNVPINPASVAANQNMALEKE